MLYLATKACQKSLKSKSIRAGIENIFYLLQRMALEGCRSEGQFASGSKVASPVSTWLYGNPHGLQKWSWVSVLASIFLYNLKTWNFGADEVFNEGQ